MAGSKVRKVARAVRLGAAFAAAAVLLGVGTPVVAHSVSAADVHRAGLSDPGLSSDGLAALASATAIDPAAPDLHPVVPHGYFVPAPVAPTPAARATASATPSRTVPRATTTPVRPTTAPTPTGSRLPLPVNVGSSTQVITVVAPAGSTSATLTAWQLGPAGWTVAVGPVTAKVGKQGVGKASETTSHTPAGTFTLTEGFGRLGNPGLRLPYRVIDGQDWWVSDVNSPLYNQHTRCAPGTCPFDERAGENLWSEGTVYNHALVIDYNRGGTPGAGSAFFLHVTNGIATAGCVAIDDGHLVAIMKWLDPAAHPLISIGVG